MFSAQELLRQLLPCKDAPVWWLGLSGGMDSMLLLDVLVELRDHHALPPLKALHVHHGLHADADGWVTHCAAECRRRGVELVIERVKLADGPSIEAQARDARYQAFVRHMGQGDCLLLAHHQDDQLETLLFRILRGTGLRGLAGMPKRRPLGSGYLFRPLLDWTRAELAEAAQQRGLQWIEDPANQDPRFARTALRHTLLPLLQREWPGSGRHLLRLAEHAQEANLLLDERAQEDSQSLSMGVTDPWLKGWQSLDCAGLQRLSPARQANLLRYWLRTQADLSPPHAVLDTLLGQLGAADDSQPMVNLSGWQLIRSSGRLWLLKTGIPPVAPMLISPLQPVIQLPDNGQLHCSVQAGAIRGLEGEWQLRYRQGGEQIKLPGRPTQALKDLFQQAGLPVWLRSRIPLLYCDQQLVSVGGRWNAEWASCASDEMGFCLIWVP
ncbi:MAG: tRNA lysidine(34) synthetase TilS [Gammaproteobacteria bacterium HGW-Gammaproteobacteria-11]|nr:MAG: tRNA lysidine(34) synthetase TilS [Gammaproteobacteria bacterium HGW-Gammaproteobacteria-11]